MDTVGLRIKKIRDEFGLNQKRFAQRLGVTNAHISRMEKGITIPSEALARLICKEFGVSMAWFKTGEGPMLLSDSHKDNEEADLERVAERLVKVLERQMEETEFLGDMKKELAETREQVYKLRRTIEVLTTKKLPWRIRRKLKKALEKAERSKNDQI